MAEMHGVNKSEGQMPDDTIAVFRDEYRPFSNMFRAPVAWGDAVTPARIWPLNELPYVLAKTLSAEKRALGIAEFGRAEAKDRDRAGEAIRSWGRKLALRAEWDSVKRELMLALVRDKFARSLALGEMLLATGERRIEEGNTWGDVYWGIALSAIPERGIRAGDGENHLGRILMQVRDELRRGERHPALPI